MENTMNFNSLLSLAKAKDKEGYYARTVARHTGKSLRYFPSPIVSLSEVRKACAYSPELLAQPLVSVEEILNLPIPFHFRMEVARTLLGYEPRTASLEYVHLDLTPEVLTNLWLLTQDCHVTIDGYAILSDSNTVYLDSPLLEALLQAVDGDTNQLERALTTTFASYS